MRRNEQVYHYSHRVHKLLFEGTKTFVKSDLVLLLMVVLHLRDQCLEIIPVDKRSISELPRIYLNYNLIKSHLDCEVRDSMVSSKVDKLLSLRKTVNHDEIEKACTEKMIVISILARIDHPNHLPTGNMILFFNQEFNLCDCDLITPSAKDIICGKPFGLDPISLQNFSKYNSLKNFKPHPSHFSPEKSKQIHDRWKSAIRKVVMGRHLHSLVFEILHRSPYTMKYLKYQSIIEKNPLNTDLKMKGSESTDAEEKVTEMIHHHPGIAMVDSPKELKKPVDKSLPDLCQLHKNSHDSHSFHFNPANSFTHSTSKRMFSNSTHGKAGNDERSKFKSTCGQPVTNGNEFNDNGMTMMYEELMMPSIASDKSVYVKDDVKDDNQDFPTKPLEQPTPVEQDMTLRHTMSRTGSRLPSIRYFGNCVDHHLEKQGSSLETKELPKATGDKFDYEILKQKIFDKVNSTRLILASDAESTEISKMKAKKTERERRSTSTVIPTSIQEKVKLSELSVTTRMESRASCRVSSHLPDVNEASYGHQSSERRYRRRFVG